MAHKTLVGGTAYEIKGGKTLVGGTGYAIKKGRTLVDGTGYDISFSSGVALADFAEGEVVYLNESGTPVEFYVACHNYESDLNGEGRTLLVRKEVHSQKIYDADGTYYYNGSDIDLFLNGDYLATLDMVIQSIVGGTKIYVGTTPSILEKSVFLLSVCELGAQGTSTSFIAGTLLPIAETLCAAYDEAIWVRENYSSKFGPSSNPYWYAHSVTNGVYATANEKTAIGVVPCFTLPATAMFDANNKEFVSA